MRGAERFGSSGRTSGRVVDRPGLRRREVLRGAGLLLGAVLLPRLRARGVEPYGLPEDVRAKLEESALVTISPLHRDGRESHCHGEVWFLFDGGDVLISTERTTWKARALASDRDGARIWVGKLDRGGSTFLARARAERDRAAFERLLEAFGRKYPEGWQKWEPRFKQGYEDGSRILIRYEPVGP